MPVDGGAPLLQWFGDKPQLMMFDLDGTLVDSVADVAAAVDQMRRQLDLAPLGVDRVRMLVGRGAEVLLDRVMSDAAGLRAEAGRLFAEAYAAHVHVHSTLYPDVMTALELFSGWCPLVCITNKPMRFTLPLIDSIGLAKKFSLILAGDSFEEKKPHPRALEHAMDYFEVPPEKSLMIGDSRNDVLAARAAGVRCVVLRWGYNHGEPLEECSPDWIVNSITELL